MILGADVGQVYTDYRLGSILNSGRSLDLAIQNSGNAFFTIGSDDGQGLAEYYTRDGAFNIDSMGRLVTSNGLPVLGTDGRPIAVSSENFTVDADGTVTAGGRAAGRLMIRQFTDASGLRKRGDNLLEATAALEQTEFTGNVTQGALEQSNVNVIREMVDMITVTRSYEANQKIISALDSTLDKAVNEVGAVR
jgi:flagellar basal-body rod protein FlgG